MKGNIMMRMLSVVLLVSLALAHFSGQVDLTQASWLWLTAFAAFNAFQSTFTGFCPPEMLLKKFGVMDANCCGSEKACTTESSEKKEETK